MSIQDKVIIWLLIGYIIFLLVEGILFDEIQRWKSIYNEEKRKNQLMHDELEHRYSEGWSDGYNERRNERW